MYDCYSKIKQHILQTFIQKIFYNYIYIDKLEIITFNCSYIHNN